MADIQGNEAPPDDCCVDPRIPKHFDASSRKRTKGDALPEMRAVTQRLYHQLNDAEELKPTLLELGSGTGALAVALAFHGVTRADGIDLSPVSVATARRRAEAAGLGDRVTFEVGDAAQVPLAKHDWVVLDRVMCCYPNVDRLLANAIPAAGSRFAFAVPNSRGWRGIVSRILIPLEFVITTLQRIPCRAYVHSLDVIEDRLRAEGFSLRSRTSGLWYTAVWERRTT
jgi:SAM-dependent methyltransferase